jgi:hypothetical protein
MVDYRPTSDAEWHYLQRRYAVFQLQPWLREIFDNSLPGSPYTPTERRQYKREIHEAVRSMIAPTEAYPNAYFELTWIRAVERNPALLSDLSINRALLWEAYFQSEEPPGARERARDRWKQRAGDHVELVITTDRELEADSE